jgi:hypothetical protein
VGNLEQSQGVQGRDRPIPGDSVARLYPETGRSCLLQCRMSKTPRYPVCSTLDKLNSQRPGFVSLFFPAYDANWAVFGVAVRGRW